MTRAHQRQTQPGPSPAGTTEPGGRAPTYRAPTYQAPTYRSWILALACAGSFVVIMDATVVSVAMPDIRAALGFSASSLSWVVNAYTLTFAGFLLLGGRCVDVFGPRRVLVLGMGLFTVARLVAGLAGTPAVMLTARAVQGFGAALLMPVVLSLITTTFTELNRRTRALATWSAVGAVAAAAGPVLGGALTEATGWRSVFFVTLPVGVAGVVGAYVLLPADGRRTRGERKRLDVVGATLATAGLVGIVYAVMRAGAVGWTGADVQVPMLSGLALLGVFLLHQARWVVDPLVPLRIFRLRSVSAANATMFLLGLGFFASPVLLSLYARDVHQFSPMAAGLGYLPTGAAMFVGARAAGRLTVRYSARATTVGCCAVATVGFAGVAALIGVDAPYWLAVLLPSTLFGFGTAAAFTPVTVVATGDVPAADSGLAAGLLNTVRQTSSAIGLAVLTTIAAAATAAFGTGVAGSGAAGARSALAHGYAVAFGVAALCVAGAAVLAAVTLPSGGTAGRTTNGAVGRVRTK